MADSNKIKSYVAHNHLVVKTCQGDTSHIKTINLGWARHVSFSLKEEGTHWVLVADYAADGAAVQESLAHFRDHKEATKALCRVSCALRRKSDLWGGLWRTALLTAVGAFVAVGVLAGMLIVLRPALEPLPMKRSMASDPAIMNQLSQLKSLAERLAARGGTGGSVSPGTTMSTPKPEEYGVPLSADEVLGAQ